MFEPAEVAGKEHGEVVGEHRQGERGFGGEELFAAEPGQAKAVPQFLRSRPRWRRVRCSRARPPGHRRSRAGWSGAPGICSRGSPGTHGARGRPQRWRESRHRAGACDQERAASRSIPGGRDSRHRQDRSRLGADLEESRGHRHKPRRAHLPRRDREPRSSAPRAGFPVTASSARSISLPSRVPIVKSFPATTENPE